jgi:hypothetical protein
MKFMKHEMNVSYNDIPAKRKRAAQAPAESFDSDAAQTRTTSEVETYDCTCSFGYFLRFRSARLSLKLLQILRLAGHRISTNFVCSVRVGCQLNRPTRLAKRTNATTTPPWSSYSRPPRAPQHPQHPVL